MYKLEATELRKATILQKSEPECPKRAISNLSWKKKNYGCSKANTTGDLVTARSCIIPLMLQWIGEGPHMQN